MFELNIEYCFKESQGKENFISENICTLCEGLHENNGFCQYSGSEFYDIH